jgi:hypothetical protein
VADAANSRNRATEELLPMALETGGVLRIVGDIRKCVFSLSYLFPIRRRELMAGITRLLVLCDLVAESRIPSRSGWSCGLTASLWFGQRRRFGPGVSFLFGPQKEGTKQRASANQEKRCQLNLSISHLSLCDF